VLRDDILNFLSDGAEHEPNEVFQAMLQRGHEMMSIRVMLWSLIAQYRIEWLPNRNLKIRSG
jgi:hypothetical protein